MTTHVAERATDRWLGALMVALWAILVEPLFGRRPATGARR